MFVKNQISSFNYLGGKYSYLQWLLPLLPESKHFIDVFGGSAVVLLNREPSQIETYNDINKKVVNFFEVLRSDTDSLIAALQLTPYSKHEYDQAWFSDFDTPIERARKFFIRTQQSVWAAGAQDQPKGWAVSINDSRVKMSEKVSRWINSINNLQVIAERLRTVQIENRDFRFILKKYDAPDHLMYLDSPYDPTYRSNTPYEFDFGKQDFYDMHYYCKNAKGLIAVSGYDTPFMNDLFTQFNKHKGPLRKNNRSDKEAYESLWTNY